MRNNASLHHKTVSEAERLAKEAKAARRRKPQRNPKVVINEETYRVPPEVLEAALKLADGDMGRIELRRDGSIMVWNSREQRNSK